MHSGLGYAAVGLVVLYTALSTAKAQQANPYNHAVHITPLLVTGTTVTGQPIEYPHTNKPEVKILRVVIPPGAHTGWHTHPVPCYAYILSGTLTVKFDGGKQEVLHAGDACAETVNTLHEGVNEGKEPVVLIMFVTGVRGEPFALKTSAASH